MYNEVECLIVEKYNQTKYKANYRGFYQIYVKRLIDVFVCLMILPLVLIITVPVAMAIKLEDKGPVFYKSMRLGVGFKEFGMLKFRSMKVDSPDTRNEDGSTYNSKNDPRVTKVGKFLRETSLDEVPQILNVLFGQMSLIGPRAGDVESKDTYQIDEKDKLLIRPGISGYTQAYFRNDLGVREKRMFDAWYAHNVTFFLDIKIIIKTIITVLKKENIYTNK